jgi:hypothetical protein
LILPVSIFLLSVSLFFLKKNQKEGLGPLNESYQQAGPKEPDQVGQGHIAWPVRAQNDAAGPSHKH